MGCGRSPIDGRCGAEISRATPPITRTNYPSTSRGIFRTQKPSWQKQLTARGQPFPTPRILSQSSSPSLSNALYIALQKMLQNKGKTIGKTRKKATPNTMSRYDKRDKKFFIKYPILLTNVANGILLYPQPSLAQHWNQ